MARRELKSTGKKRALIAHERKKSPISEQFRTIRTNIEFSSVDKQIKTLLVTSPGPGEGKTTTAANLAIVLAQNGNSVLLIDADLRKPTVHHTFGVLNTRGLTSLLTKKEDLEHTVQASEIEGLSLLPSGPNPPNPAELLSSKTMEHLLQSLGEKYDMIVLDTPPVMAVTDAQVLGNRVDASVLVVSNGKTDRNQAVKTKELLTQTSSKLLGVVFNNKEVKKGHYYYYYGE
ncbi:tyrosine protein kinase [Alkalihalobacillus alcalophilus ATCC 27647 = CGMCC 1.3604]|uniref:non-specific protein-tyrosine kinase n=1 Tax=Alkalihalobacillus alcalophilus ATCC 27647 = CGMCC 1.3604 TaxID=1218173 RepID=A0A094WDF5_ALKAL|nr:CpsD/CapB family tyrosine-protein kinase [Alkalihalobacillus alcalophilus]KGA95769.1 capsular biosynthesis protein [Alkalihalobacillus alcalophilus ATCC 27647 = CGMCC 1.3604]MED1563831.1 CpsD/CapB family tyrosine-protein kinase [Alkalihalobacillus alcalophilus]THG92049.1 tyrosine protein kinase [Alkalihalobacillus alcalophilus ATCC 27647 = CGMCC 1.3604]